jgi:two-component system, chemotaxis family, sensor kinase CheA
VSLSQYVGLFSAESREHIATINRLLLELEADPSAREPVEGLFRATHTIKGMSATLGFGGVTDLAHELESVLDGVRAARLEVTQELVDALFGAADALALGVEDAVAEREPNEEIGALTSRLRRFAGSGGDPTLSPSGSRSVRRIRAPHPPGSAIRPPTMNVR